MAAGLGSAVVSGSAVPPAGAQSCPDVEEIFARGTTEAPGVGPTGEAFTEALRSRLGDRSLEVYPVNYPATDQWATGIDGIRDASTHIISTAENCPQTKMVLGGFSQGAAVMGFVTSAEVPDGVDPATVPKPLDPAVAEHVSSVVLFGSPNARAMSFLNQPQFAIGPLYQAKTLQLCIPEDPVCSDGLNFAMHDSYPGDADMINQAADFAASRLGGSTGAPANPGPEQAPLGDAGEGSPRGGFGN